MEDTIKISGNPEKLTTPGKKKVYRIINMTNHRSEGDYITLEEENPNQEERLKMFHPVHTYISKFVTSFKAVELHHEIFKNGQLVYTTPSLTVIQDYVEKQLELLWDEYKRTINPEEYPVDLSTKTWENKMKKIESVRNKISK